MPAKSEASKRSEIVNFQPETNWSNGWDVEESDGTLIRRFDGIPAAYSVSASVTSVGFRNDGSITTSAAYTVKLQPATGCTAELVREIRVTITGTISVIHNGTCS